jgi:hypothetical protein
MIMVITTHRNRNENNENADCGSAGCHGRAETTAALKVAEQDAQTERDQDQYNRMSDGHGIEPIHSETLQIDEWAGVGSVSGGKVSVPTKRSSPLDAVTLKTTSTDPVRAKRGNDIV